MAHGRSSIDPKGLSKVGSKDQSGRYTNRITRESYEQAGGRYIQGSPASLSGKLKGFIDRSLEELDPRETSILEIGAGFGRDALYLQELGFSVLATDAVDFFIEELQSRGLNAQKLDIIEDELPSAQVVFANAVLLHLDRDEFRRVIGKIYQSLPQGGRLIFTVKEGEGEGWSFEKLDAPRYFTYWSLSEIFRELLLAGFTSVDIDEDRDSSQCWLQVRADR